MTAAAAHLRNETPRHLCTAHNYYPASYTDRMDGIDGKEMHLANKSARGSVKFLSVSIHKVTDLKSLSSAWFSSVLRAS